jgi:hypothetical protein
MTVRAPAYELTVGSRQWTQHVLGMDVRLRAAPLVDEVIVRLPSAVDLGASLGDDVVLSLDGGDRAEVVFHGSMTTHARSIEETLVIATDAGHRLAAYRPAVTFEQATAATIIRALCADVGVAVAQVEDEPQLAYYAADPTRSAWEHIGRVAAWGGALVRVDEDGRVRALKPASAGAEAALGYGRDVLVLTRVNERRPVDEHVVAGESGVGGPDDPDALRPTTDFFAGRRPDGPGPATSWAFAPALRTAGAARALSEHRAARYQSSGRRWRVDALLQPALRPGAALEVQGLPDGLAGGTLVVEASRHRLTPSEAFTQLWLVEGGAAAGGSGSLAGLAAQAIGA